MQERFLEGRTARERVSPIVSNWRRSPNETPAMSGAFLLVSAEILSAVLPRPVTPKRLLQLMEQAVFSRSRSSNRRRIFVSGDLRPSCADLVRPSRAVTVTDPLARRQASTRRGLDFTRPLRLSAKVFQPASRHIPLRYLCRCSQALTPPILGSPPRMRRCK